MNNIKLESRDGQGIKLEVNSNEFCPPVSSERTDLGYFIKMENSESQDGDEVLHSVIKVEKSNCDDNEFMFNDNLYNFEMELSEEQRIQNVNFQKQQQNCVREAKPKRGKKSECGDQQQQQQSDKEFECYPTLYHCEECETTFSLRTSLQRHMKSVHFRTREYKCTMCDKDFDRKDSLTRHKRLLHSNELQQIQVPDDYIKEHEISVFDGNTSSLFEFKNEGAAGENSTRLETEPEMVQQHKLQTVIRYECLKCNRFFTKKSYLKRHKKRQHPEDQMMNHVRDGPQFKEALTRPPDKSLLFKKKKYNCTDCGKQFHRKDSLTRHARLQHEQDQLEIEIQEDFVKQEELDVYSENDPPQLESDKELLNYTEDYAEQTNETLNGPATKEYPCYECNTSYPKRMLLLQHNRLQHPESGEYNCAQCNTSFSLKTSLRRHIKSIHSKKREFKCPLCGKQFHRKDSLVRHNRLLHPESQSTEMHVEEDFISNEPEIVIHSEDETENLSEFEEIQFNESFDTVAPEEGQAVTEFPCPYCSHMFAKIYNLTRHIKRQHTETQGFMCTFCGKNFKREDSLRRHIVEVHTALKFECPNCDRVFSRKNKLAKHIEQVHSNQTLDS